jgi:multidrug efflux pump subunit AcrB
VSESGLIAKLLRNHPLANIAFAVVIVLGAMSYLSMPREQDPEINFNFVVITTVLPGASADDVETRVTNPLEDAVRNVQDIRFVSSASRESVSLITVRFRELPERIFDKRVNDLRREIQNKANQELPADIVEPDVLEITTSNGFPTAAVALIGQADDEALRAMGYQVQKEIERIDGVDRVLALGLNDPELTVNLSAQALAARGLTAVDASDAVSAWFRDSFAGRIGVGNAEWMVRLLGQDPSPEFLAGIPVQRAGSELRTPLDQLGTVERSREKAAQKISVDGQPAVLLSISKRGQVNTLTLLDNLNAYLKDQNAKLAPLGMRLLLTDDQTIPTRTALGIMESNALISLLLVLAVCWVFLGTRISLLVASGVVFSIAGTLWVLNLLGSTLNVQVFVGIVVVLGMLVDDAIVIVEDIYYRIERGAQALPAALASIHSVFAPVTASVATTMAAFLPLILLPGIVGQFLSVIPMVVVLGLAISLIEAYWILPTHVVALKPRDPDRPLHRVQAWRTRFTFWLRLRYTRLLIVVLRRTWIAWALALGVLVIAIGGLTSGRVKFEFFAFDPLRVFYVNVDLPPSASLAQTLRETERVAEHVRAHIAPEALRAITVQTGLKFTEQEPLYGDQYGQVIVSLNPREAHPNESSDWVAALRPELEKFPGAGAISFIVLTGGPPNTLPINLRVRADDFGELRAATNAVKAIIAEIPGVKDLTDDESPGRPQLKLSLDREAITNAGLSPLAVSRLIRLHGEGEIVSDLRDDGEKVEVRVRIAERTLEDIDQLLNDPIALPNGGTTTLGALTARELGVGRGTIRHFKLKRSITVSADLEPGTTNTLAAVEKIQQAWKTVGLQHPNASLDFSGEFEDIQESLNAMLGLFVLGMGLIYLILATQFRSYFQPFLILTTVPFAFTGVAIGLLVSGYPMSLYTLYGTIALAGVAVNSAIVLMDAANDRIQSGMSLLHATIYAARRRMVPILMTTSTTIAGLTTLAFGIGGKSLLWGPVAASLFWGLLVSTVLTLFVIPVLYRAVMRRSGLVLAANQRSSRF